LVSLERKLKADVTNKPCRQSQAISVARRRRTSTRMQLSRTCKYHSRAACWRCEAQRVVKYSEESRRKSTNFVKVNGFEVLHVSRDGEIPGRSWRAGFCWEERTLSDIKPRATLHTSGLCNEDIKELPYLQLRSQCCYRRERYKYASIRCFYCLSINKYKAQSSTVKRNFNNSNPSDYNHNIITSWSP
jgi:hypothetical protein